MHTKEKEFKQQAHGFLHKPNPVQQKDFNYEPETCRGCDCDEDEVRHLYDFGCHKMCRECLITDMMVDLQDDKFSRNEELADFYFNQGVELEDAKDMVKHAWGRLTENNLALRAKPITGAAVSKTINRAVNQLGEEIEQYKKVA